MSMKLSDIISPEAVIPQLVSTERDGVVRELVDGLVAAGKASKKLGDELVEAVISREKKGSTGFGKGVAVPHVKHDDIKAMGAAIGISPSGVDFNALDKQPVFTVMLLLSPAGKPDQHLQAMESIFTNLQKDRFRSFLRQATTVQQVLDVIEEADSQTLYG